MAPNKITDDENRKTKVNPAEKLEDTKRKSTSDSKNKADRTSPGFQGDKWDGNKK